MSVIRFAIQKDGSVNLEVSGAKGLSCEELTRSFEEALGVKVKVEFKPEEFVVFDGIKQYIAEE